MSHTDASSVLTSLAAGLAGAAVLTAVHETTRRVAPSTAPRMDILGERAIVKMMRGAGVRPPRGEALHRLALGGDLASNSLYYSMVGSGPNALARGAGLGLLAGIGAVILPPYLGLGRAPRGLTTRTKLMTVGYYVIGGLAAAAVSRLLNRSDDDDHAS